jgi:hypothetical protein
MLNVLQPRDDNVNIQYSAQKSCDKGYLSEVHGLNSAKREKFHISIRKQDRESVFSKKRRVQKLSNSSDQPS